jgi:hypothetical protein
LVINATANFLILEGVVGHGTATRPSLEAFGQWPWLRMFDHEDLEEFVAEMRQALVIAARERSVRHVNETLKAWYNTAVSLDDPLRQDILLSGVADDDEFVEAKRPEAVDDPVLTAG